MQASGSTSHDRTTTGSHRIVHHEPQPDGMSTRLLIHVGYMLAEAFYINFDSEACSAAPIESIDLRQLQAQATGFTLLLGCRIMIGLAQSFGTPASYS